MLSGTAEAQDLQWVSVLGLARLVLSALPCLACPSSEAQLRPGQSSVRAGSVSGL